MDAPTAQPAIEARQKIRPIEGPSVGSLAPRLIGACTWNPGAIAD